jgi:hypothetical protein
MQMLEGLCSANDSNGDGVMSFQEIRKLFDMASGDKDSRFPMDRKVI